jgi:hypothetical protein
MGVAQHDGGLGAGAKATHLRFCFHAKQEPHFPLPLFVQAAPHGERVLRSRGSVLDQRRVA